LKRENNSLMSKCEKLSRDMNDAIRQKELAKSSMNALTREIEYMRKQSQKEE
jgi:hypothetical protein